VAILASSDAPADRARAYDLGANSFLVKPLEYGALVELAGRVCAYWLDRNVRPPE
jgi:DNA-binding response OmpR family regulator